MGDAPSKTFYGTPCFPIPVMIVVLIEEPASRTAEGCCKELLCIVDICFKSFEIDREFYGFIIELNILLFTSKVFGSFEFLYM